MAMFEKEAKERARKIEKSQILGVYDSDEDYARDSGWNDGEVVGYEEGFKDGAEFGYELGKNECHCIKDGDLPKENQDLRKQIEELKAKIERLADCSNCKHWHYSARLLSFYCDCSDKISNSTDSRTYEHCDKWELE